MQVTIFRQKIPLIAIGLVFFISVVYYVHPVNNIVQEKDASVQKIITTPFQLPEQEISQDTNQCRPHRKIDPFDAEVVKYMVDLPASTCQYANNLKVTQREGAVEIRSDKGFVFLNHYPVQFDQENKFKLLAAKKILENTNAIKKGTKGALRNVPSRRCVFPKYSKKLEGGEILLIFSTDCTTDDAMFEYEESGVFRHKSTKKCIGPKGGATKLARNVQLVLGEDCTSTFEVVGGGLLKHPKGFCVHPLWGGQNPEEGQYLCYYDDCTDEPRLQYTSVKKDSDNEHTTQVKLGSELSQIDVGFTDVDISHLFFFAIQPQPIPANDALPNIILLTIEESSAAHLQRKLKTSYKFIVEEMSMSIYPNYIPIDSNTDANLLSLYTGAASLEGRKQDLFSMARTLNYATLFSHDNSDSHLTLNAHHNSVPLFDAINFKFDVSFKKYCAAGVAIYDYSFAYLRSFLDAYKSSPKLASVVLGQITRANFNALGQMDSSLRDTLQALSKLKNTVVVLNTIKGSNKGKLGQLKQGIAERTAPFLGVYLSPDIRHKYALDKSRADKFVNPYDVYATLKRFLSEENRQNIHGVSLFNSVTHRSCSDMGIEKHMCPC